MFEGVWRLPSDGRQESPQRHRDTEQKDRVTLLKFVSVPLCLCGDSLFLLVTKMRAFTEGRYNTYAVGDHEVTSTSDNFGVSYRRLFVLSYYEHQNLLPWSSVALGLLRSESLASSGMTAQAATMIFAIIPQPV